MCDVRLFHSAWIDLQTAEMTRDMAVDDELFLNTSAYHLQQAVEKLLKGALECNGVAVSNTDNISKLVQMVFHNGAHLVITPWIDDHSEMLSEWESESRYNLDFLVEKRKLEKALEEVACLFEVNGITPELRKELQDPAVKAMLLRRLPVSKRNAGEFELNAYYLMFSSDIGKDSVKES